MTSTHGGKRPGAGRPSTGRTNRVGPFMLSSESIEWLNGQSNKSKAVENLIQKEIAMQKLPVLDSYVFATMTDGGPGLTIVGVFNPGTRTYLGCFSLMYPEQTKGKSNLEFEYTANNYEVTFLGGPWLNEKGDFAKYFLPGQVIPQEVWDSIDFQNTVYEGVYSKYLKAA